MRFLLEQRAHVFALIREYFLHRKVLEVETAYLSKAGNTDPYIESYAIADSHHKRYLHTSPEYGLKRLLASGSGDIYQLCKVWRRDEVGAHHNPEFTMLEWYRTRMSYLELAEEVVELLTILIPDSSKREPRFVTYCDLFLEITHINPHKTTREELQQCLREHSIDIHGMLDKQGLLDLVMTHVIEPIIRIDQIIVVHDYPSSQAALSVIDDGVAKRFEVYYLGMELANGYQELGDAKENRKVLKQDAKAREDRGQEAVPLDELFLESLERGLPDCSGVALGIDRVMMCRMHKKRIEEVISFPWSMA